MTMQDRESADFGEEIVLTARQIIASLAHSFKLLETLLDHSSTSAGREAIAQDIIAVSESGEGFQTTAIDLAEYSIASIKCCFLHPRLIPLVTSKGGRTLTVSVHPSRGFDNNIVTLIEQVKRNQKLLKSLICYLMTQ